MMLGMAKAGQPPKYEGRPAEARVEFRCLPEDKASWQKLADEAGLSLSEWIVRTLKAAPKKITKKSR